MLDTDAALLGRLPGIAHEHLGVREAAARQRGHDEARGKRERQPRRRVAGEGGR